MSDMAIQILVLILFYLYSFLFFRSFLSGVKMYQLNKSALKKRAKGESIKEWFLYTRYREEIPKALLDLYFIMLMINFLAIILCLVFGFIKQLEKAGYIVVQTVFIFDSLCDIVLRLLFWQKKPGYKYERWIKKKRGNKKDS